MNSTLGSQFKDEHLETFRIRSDRAIPDGQTPRASLNPEMLENLLRLPAHRQGTVKFDPKQMYRTLSPLTLEDTQQFDNLGLIATLRQEKINKTVPGKDAGVSKGANDNVSQSDVNSMV